MALVAWVLYAALMTVVLLLYLWFCRPDLIVKYGLRYYLYKSGMSVRSVRGRRYTYVYGERGQRSPSRTSMLLIHGFSASKDMWVPLVKRLPDYLHILVVDLPGHGGTEIPGDSDPVSAEEYAHNVHEFVELVGMSERPFHVVGTSLGGIIASVYSMQHIDLVERLTLICPSFETPVSTRFMEEVRRGECRLIPENVEDMVTMMGLTFYNQAMLPQNRQLIRGTLALRLPKTNFYWRLFNSLTEDMPSKKSRLEDEIKRITCPVQLIWGKQDELVHISGVDYLRDLLPNVERVDLLDNCGHSVSYEKPGATAKFMLQFRGELTDKKSS